MNHVTKLPLLFTVAVAAMGAIFSFINPMKTAYANNYSIYLPIQYKDAVAAKPTTTSVPVESLPARPQAAALPVSLQDSNEFQSFFQNVVDGQAGVVRGVYVNGLLALRVVQQPVDDWNYVSKEMGEVTQFYSAEKAGSIGLLAHNFLSGQLFYNLKSGEEVDIVYGNGAVSRFEIGDIERYQRVNSSDLSGPLIDLHDNQEITSAAVFDREYRPGSLTFQTCIKNNDDPSWGLLFVTATPLQ